MSWDTAPYYYGADIVFLFAWTPFLAVGAAGVLSLDAAVAARARSELRLAQQPTAASSPQVLQQLRRRTLLRGGQVVALAGVVGGALGGVSAVVGRAIGGTRTTGSGSALGLGGGAGAPSAEPSVAPSAAATGGGTPTSKAAGTAIGLTSQVPVGQGASFTDPTTGEPAWVVHPSGSTFLAFSAVCTHAGCTVQFDASAMQFQCPCHGGVYNARTGQVISGPPPAPLPAIPVKVVGNVIRVDG